MPIQYAIKPGHSKHRHWDVGSRGREAMVTPLRSRVSVTMIQEGTSKPEGDARAPLRAPARSKSGRSIRHPVPKVHRADRNPVIFDREKCHGDKQVKHVKVMERVNHQMLRLASLFPGWFLISAIVGFTNRLISYGYTLLC